uniref:alcohol dehydrogenase catalytic domain-containing protein n=1 Tax=Actinotalea sp. C106 TaxID=2908644 RepID=UPI002027E912
MSTTVRATEVVMPHRVEPDGLLVRHRDLPAPGAGQALVRVEATGVSFAEQQMRRGKYYDQPPFPFVPGYDLVGVVEAIGEGGAPGLVGVRVATVVKVGGWASHLLVDATHLVPVPPGVDPAEAETLIVNGLTAWQMLHGVAKVRRGQTVVVLGANGGVGSTLVQLAVEAGITVIGTAAPRHHDLVRGLGATPVDHRAPQLADKSEA